MTYLLALAYNEEHGIVPCLQYLHQILSSREKSFRFVVIDDGSIDRTAQKVKELQTSMPVILLQHAQNMGVAKAFDTGLRHIVGLAQSDDDIIITLEGDNTNDSSYVLDMIDRIRSGDDVVCASRYLAEGHYVGFPWLRYMFSFVANWSMRLFFPVGEVRDYTIFYRAYRARVIAEAIRHFGDRFIERRGFTANAEILYKVAATLPIRCSEIPLVYRYDLKKGDSKMRVFRNVYEYGQLFMRLLTLPRQHEAPTPPK